MDIRMDGWTELRQQYRALHYVQSHGKKQTTDKIKGLTEIQNYSMI